MVGIHPKTDPITIGQKTHKTREKERKKERGREGVGKKKKKKKKKKMMIISDRFLGEKIESEIYSDPIRAGGSIGDV